MGNEPGKQAVFEKHCDMTVTRQLSVFRGSLLLSSLALWERAGVRGLHAVWSVATDNRTPDDERLAPKIKLEGKVFARNPRKNQCFAPHTLSSLYPAAHEWQPSGIFTAEDAESRRGVAGSLKACLITPRFPLRTSASPAVHCWTYRAQSGPTSGGAGPRRGNVMLTCQRPAAGAGMGLKCLVRPETKGRSATQDIPRSLSAGTQSSTGHCSNKCTNVNICFGPSVPNQWMKESRIGSRGSEKRAGSVSDRSPVVHWLPGSTHQLIAGLTLSGWRPAVALVTRSEDHARTAQSAADHWRRYCVTNGSPADQRRKQLTVDSDAVKLQRLFAAELRHNWKLGERGF